ncbi:MAG: hypothetical protein ACM3MF_01960, partial [Anaerolineae bacterium]
PCRCGAGKRQPAAIMAEEIGAGDRVSIYLSSDFWSSEGWYEGTVVRIDPYSGHRGFYWVELDSEVQAAHGGRTRLVSVLNPARIRKI